jgi:excinuclease ABC subunit C
LKNSPELVERVAENKSEYLKNIKAVTSVLEGKRTSMLKNFKKEMLELGKKNKFEKAIALRDKFEKLEKVFENARIIHNSSFLIHDSKDIRKNRRALIELAKLLKLKCSPNRIEGYDISNIQGQFATGAMVVFIDGQPDKSQYRRFKIRLNEEPNDIAMLKEVLTRRFNHPEWPYPDLIIVDGGIGQLNVARSVIPKNIPVIALTKDARHRGSHINLGSSQDPRLKKTATPLTKLPEPVRNLILQIDTEAHRFAISYYRKLHRQWNEKKNRVSSHDGARLIAGDSMSP